MLGLAIFFLCKSVWNYVFPFDIFFECEVVVATLAREKYISILVESRIWINRESLLEENGNTIGEVIL